MHRVKLVTVLSLLMYFILSTTSGWTQSQEKAYAVLLNNFTKNIQWPVLQGNTFVIGVLSYPPLAGELRSVTQQRNVAGKNIEIKELTSLEEAKSCQIVFIPAFKSKALLTAEQMLKKIPLLIVTNKPDLALQGSDINFILQDGKVQFEINAATIEARGLKVSGTLKGLGIIVK